MSAGAATIAAAAVEGRKATVRRYWVRRALALLCALLFGLMTFTVPDKGVVLPFDGWKVAVESLSILVAVFSIFVYAIGYRPRRGAWFWNLFPWALLGWIVYYCYESTLVSPNETDDVLITLVVIAGTAFLYPFFHLLFRFRAVGRLPEVPGAQPARGWKRWLGLRAERDVWSGAVPHPRWFQFGIAGPALVVTLWCVWLGLKVEQLRTQRETAARLQKQGIRLEMHDLSEWEEAVAPYLPRQLLVDVRSTEFYSSDTGDEAIADLQSFRCLEVVAVDNEDGRYSDEAIRKIGSLSMLEHLDLRSFPVTDETLIALSGLKKLKYVSFQSNHVTDRGIQAISACPLEYLTIECEQVTDESAMAIGECETMENLDLFGGKFSDRGLAAIMRLPRLYSLSFADQKIDGAGFAAGVDNTRFAYLWAINTELNDAAISHLSKYQALTSLTIDGANLTEASAQDFRQFRSLENATLGHAPVSDQVLLSLCTLPSLRTLTMRSTQVHGESLWGLQNAPKLVDLELSDSPVTDSGFAAVIRALRAPCNLSFEGTPITDEAFTLCGPSRCVHSLDCSRTWITDAGIAQCRQFQPLFDLYFKWTLVTRSSLDTLTSMKQLNHLCADGTPIGMMSDEEWDKLFPDTIVYTGREGLE